MRLAAAAVVAIALHAGGCLPAGFRVGQPPIDAGWYTLRNRLMDVVPRATSDALMAAAPAGGKRAEAGWMSSGSSGEHEWSRHVRFDHTDGRNEPLPPAQYETMMRAIETALLAELGDGIEVLDRTPTRPARERPGAVGFVIRYARANGGVAGDLVGLVEPSRQYAGHTRVTVIHTEWCTR